MTPGVLILIMVSVSRDIGWVVDAYQVNQTWKSGIRLTFEIFHDIQKANVDVWFVSRLHPDLIKITESVLYVSCQSSIFWSYCNRLSMAEECRESGRSPDARSEHLLSTLSSMKRLDPESWLVLSTSHVLEDKVIKKRSSSTTKATQGMARNL